MTPIEKMRAGLDSMLPVQQPRKTLMPAQERFERRVLLEEQGDTQMLPIPHGLISPDLPTEIQIGYATYKLRWGGRQIALTHDGEINKVFHYANNSELLKAWTDLLKLACDL